MPTETFYSINQSKRDKVTEAIRKEFANSNLPNFSVKNIVNESGIARGSFYQYFDSKDDVINYIIDDEYNKELEKIKKVLIANKGDLFTASYEYLVRGLDVTDEEARYVISVMEYLKNYAIYKVRNMNLQDLKDYIKFDTDRKIDDSDFVSGITIILTLICITKLYILEKLITREEGLKYFKILMNLIQKGVESGANK